VIRSRFKLPAEGSRSSGTTRVLTVDVAHERKDDVAGALRELIGRLPPHSGILPLIDAGVSDDGRPFIVIPHVNGESLDAALSVYGPAALADALPRLQQLADALDLGASHGLCHGALDPGDIMVSTDETAVVGLGVAGALRNACGAALPHTAYTAPEVERGEMPTAASDQFALAVIAHEWLFGRRIGVAASGFADGALRGVNTARLKDAFATATASAAAERYANCTAFVHAIAESTKSEGTERPRILEFTASAAGELPLNPGRDDEPRAEPPDGTPREGYGAGAIAAALVMGLVVGAAAVWMSLRSAPPSGTSNTAPSLQAAPARTAESAREVTETAIAPPRDVAVAPAARSAPQSADAAPATERDAGLLVHSTPAGALVTVDGEPRGTTPVAVRGLELGARSVVISRPGYESVARQVVLSAGRPSRTLEIALTTAGRPGPSAVARTPVTGRREGSLVIDSRPSGAAVTIDGRAVGVTPLTLPTIAAGRHTVRLERAGYRPVTTAVDVKAGERARVAARLEGGQVEK
jgi:hypothetical protein